jgi:hypothetical protein
MKVFLIQLLSITFVLLIAGSIQSVTADHLDPGKGLFKDETKTEIARTEDSNYRIYLQTVLRNADGQLIGVIHEPGGGLHGWVIPHKVTDHIFDTLMGEKEIVTIDNIKYEKVQYTFSPTLEQRTVKHYPIFEEIPIKHELDKDTRAQMEEEVRDYHRWKIHYCATFFELGHPYICLSVFQSFNTVYHVEPTDVVTHQWTILRVLN